MRRPKLAGFTAIIDGWLPKDLERPRKQRHTAKRVYDRLCAEKGFTGGYTTVKDYVRSQRQRRARCSFRWRIPRGLLDSHILINPVPALYSPELI